MSETETVKTVYFVRHGQSIANAAPVFQPPDSPLSELGKQQADLIAKRAARISFDTLISSPLPRAKETAEAIAKATGKIPEYSDIFMERIKPARINSMSHDDMDAAKLWKEWERSLYTQGVRVEDGENFDDLIERADKAIDFLSSRSEKTLVIVTHGYFMNTIIARVLLGVHLTGDVFESFQSRAFVENTSLSALKYGTTDLRHARNA